METRGAKKARLEAELAGFWQNIPNELRIKILGYLPTPDKFIYRRVSKEWKSLLEEKDIWINITRLTLAGAYWSTNQDGKLKVKPGVEEEEEVDDDDSERSDSSVGFFGTDVVAESIAKGLEDVFRGLHSAAPIRSLEIVDLEFRGGVESRDLWGLFALTRMAERGTQDLTSIVISNVHFCLVHNFESAEHQVASFVQSQSQLERLIIGPYVCWGSYDDGSNAGSLPPSLGDYEVWEWALPNLDTLDPLENLRILVLYTCHFNDLSLSELMIQFIVPRLEVFIIVQLDVDAAHLEELDEYMQDHAPELYRRTDPDFSVVYTADETADFRTLVKRSTDSVDFLTSFAEFKKSEEAREGKPAGKDP